MVPQTAPYRITSPVDFYTRLAAENRQPPEELEAAAETLASMQVISETTTTTTTTERTRQLAPIMYTRSSPQKDLTEKVANLKRKLAQAKESNKASEKKWKAEKKARTAISIKAEDTAMQMNAKKVLLQRAHNTVLKSQEEVDASSGALRSSIAAIAKLKQTVTHLAAEKKQVTQANQHLTIKYVNLKKTKDDLSVRNETSHRLVIEQEKEVRSLHNKNEQLNKLNSERGDSMLRMAATRDALIRQNNALKAIYAKARDKMMTLTDKCNQLTMQKKFLIEHTGEQYAETEKLLKENHAVHASLEESQGQVKRLREEKKDWKERSRELKEEKEHLQQTGQALAKDLEESHGIIQKSLQLHKNGQQAHEKSQNDLQAQLDKLQHKVKKLQKRDEDSKRTIKNLEEHKESLLEKELQNSINMGFLIRSYCGPANQRVQQPATPNT